MIDRIRAFWHWLTTPPAPLTTREAQARAAALAAAMIGP